MINVTRNSNVNVLFIESNEACPICEGVQSICLGRKLTMDPQSSLEVDIWRCEECGHWTTRPMPTQETLNALYSEGSLLVTSEGWAESTKSRAGMIHIAKNHWVYRDMSRFSTDSGKARNYLEIGPGDGALMSAFASDGWVCHAVEPGNWLGGDGIVSSAEGLPRELRVNTLVLHDVLEHCADPAETLGEYSKFLDIGGRVYLAFPNSDSLEARWYGPSWGMVLPFGHLNYFSYKSIEKLLERSGLQLESAHHARLGRRSEALKSLLRRPLRAVVRGIRKQSWSEFVRNLRLGLNDLISLVSKGDQWHIIAVHKNNSQ